MHSPSHALTKRCQKPMYFVISSTQWYRFLRLYKSLPCHEFETEEEEEDCLTFRYIQELYTDFVINSVTYFMCSIWCLCMW